MNVFLNYFCSKKSLEKRTQIESAFRFCKEAFLELSTEYLCMLENNKSQSLKSETIRDDVCDALSEVCDAFLAKISGTDSANLHLPLLPRCLLLLSVRSEQSGDHMARNALIGEQ